jgi:hypothetical protein
VDGAGVCVRGGPEVDVGVDDCLWHDFFYTVRNYFKN